MRHLGRANGAHRLVHRSALVGEPVAAGGGLAFISAARIVVQRRQEISLAFLNDDLAQGDVGARSKLARQEQLHRRVAGGRVADALAGLGGVRCGAVRRPRRHSSGSDQANENGKPRFAEHLLPGRTWQ